VSLDARGTQRVQLRVLRRGEPTENGNVESFDGRCRDDCISEASIRGDSNSFLVRKTEPRADRAAILPISTRCAYTLPRLPVRLILNRVTFSGDRSVMNTRHSPSLWRNPLR
jgi:hypothetical protein